MSIRLPGGFSPVNAFKQVTTGRDYDIFDNITNSNRPGQMQISGLPDPGVRSPYDVKGASTTTQPSNNKSNKSNKSTQNSYGAGGGTYNAGDGTNSASAVDADQLRWLDDQASQYGDEYGYINQTLRRGLEGLTDSYNQQKDGANQGRTRALENYGIQREDTIRGKDGALDKVNTSARTLAESLRRRLGMASGSDSSAYQTTAPGAVAREASGNRTDVLEDYGANFRGLELGEKRATEDFASLLEDLTRQKRSGEMKLKQGIQDERRGVDQSLAEIARQKALTRGGGYSEAKSAMSKYTNRADGRRQSIDSLYDKYRNPFKVDAVKPQQVNLRDYMVDRAAIQSNETAGTEDPYAPYRPRTNEEEELY